MNPFTVQTVFLLYSAFSFLSAVLIGALFWGKKDFSALLWLCGCILTSIATAVTVFRNEIPIIISFSLMVSFEALSILLFSESLKHISTNVKTKTLSWITPSIPFLLFLALEFESSNSNSQITLFMTATTTFIFCIANLFCLYQALHTSRQFSNRLFFRFLSVTFAIMSCLYLIRIVNVFIGYSGNTFDTKTLNIFIWFSLALFGSIRNLAYIVLRLHMGFADHSRLNNMNIKLSNILDERNQMILSLEKLNKSAAVNALASSIAHEINQPLGASMLNAQFAEMKLNSDPNNTSILKEIIKSILYDINRASNIIKNLSRLKSKEAGKISTINLLESINEVAEISKSKLRNSKIILDIDCSPNLQLTINLSEWQQVLINLLNNAIEALDGLNTGEKKIVISAQVISNNLQISIQDNGPGIPFGQESKIFDLMVTNKESGTGIGLWLSKNIINRYGGEITTHKSIHGGACFVIVLQSA
jgi:signal transduction histidine kinase